MAGFQLAGPAADVSKSLYGKNRKSYQSPNVQYDISDVPQCSTAKVGYVVYLDLIQLNPALHSFSSLQEKVTVLYVRPKWILP